MLETRLQSGVVCLARVVYHLMDVRRYNNKNIETNSISMPEYFFGKALETVDFMPLNSADPVGTIIQTGIQPQKIKKKDVSLIFLYLKTLILKT